MPDVATNDPTGQLEALFRELADARAELTLQRGTGVAADDLTARVRPNNPNAAEIEARLERDFGVYLLLGRASPFEVPFPIGYYTEQPWLDEVRAFCLAVVQGNFQEKLIIVRGEVKGSTYRLRLPDGREIAERWRRGLVAPWTRREVKIVRYQAY